jgi:hypothetical protein
MLACWRPAFLYRCRWAARGLVEGGAEVMGANWLALVGVQTTRPQAAMYKYCLRLLPFVCLTEGVWMSV